MPVKSNAQSPVGSTGGPGILPERPAIVVLTGAGISKESGLATFRDADGTWNRVRIEDVATPEAFETDPLMVQSFYNARRAQLADVHPNAAHIALAELERRFPGEVLLVTQNVDDLHERAGSRALIHMHGELKKARCLNCGAVLSWPGDLTPDSPCDRCRRLGQLRPHIVWFGEVPLEMDRIQTALEHCRLFVSIGTSGTVYPAAGFVWTAGQAGARTVEINLEPGNGASLFDEAFYGPATRVVPEFLARLDLTAI
ncbi:NAD-dependent protein deacylase [Phaeovibrio sulfidiphilus]|uniref:NAD-dependent protein deacylase n=1 Tax=Phaeovibrio sulfidiphilus TaxID=1220600 RepID=A0A8J7CD54_9PROT|nr:Sir2 family NAD+-dependent deacetylase [Phaeovibrio sulfidiphilus]MBE1237473.1 NAD-dependent protein deacylase [Phaeovibrio sulfidiphilus]